MEHSTVAASPEQLQAELRGAATSFAQQCCLRWVNRLLGDQPDLEVLSFWQTPRGSLHGRTPLQALRDSELRRLEAAAEAFADA